MRCARCGGPGAQAAQEGNHSTGRSHNAEQTKDQGQRGGGGRHRRRLGGRDGRGPGRVRDHWPGPLLRQFQLRVQYDVHLAARPGGYPQWRPAPGGRDRDDLVRLGADGGADRDEPGDWGPAFAATTGQGSTGTADHLKWVAQPLQTAGTGFAVPSTGALTCTTDMSATTEGVAQNPFGGAAVPSPQSDPRLANATLITLDPDNATTADFAVANTEIWAIYERLPVPGSTAATYQYLIPVARSAPGQRHTLQVAYSDGGNRVTWLVDGRSVLSTDQIGTLAFGRTYLATDHGGTPGQVTDQNVQCGLALGDDLDAGGPPGDPNREGLVELDSAPGFYYAPQAGPPTPQAFIDDQSLLGDRLWGQGVTLHDRYFEVSTSQ